MNERFDPFDNYELDDLESHEDGVDEYSFSVDDLDDDLPDIPNLEE